MPRRPRLHVPGGYYHVTLRGNHRADLFASAADRTELDEIVAEAHHRFDARLHAFCWMTNHLHALIQIGERPLGRLVQSITIRYARYRHKAMETTGHLFERRHGAKLVDSNAYLLAVLRYIHLNPVKAELVADPGEYTWTSHRAYLGTEAIGWLTTDTVLASFGADKASARREYARFMSDPEGLEEPEPESHPDDERVLGGDDFLARLQQSGAPPSCETLTLEALATRVASANGISVERLRARSSPSLTPLRLELLERALDQGVANLSDVARYLRRDPSTLSKQLRRRK